MHSLEPPQERLQVPPQLFPRVNCSPLFPVFSCSVCTVSIFPCHAKSIYLQVPKLGTKLFVSWFPKHLPTCVAFIRGRKNGWFGFSQLSYCCLSPGWHWILVQKALTELSHSSSEGFLSRVSSGHSWMCQAIFLVSNLGI